MYKFFFNFIWLTCFTLVFVVVQPARATQLTDAVSLGSLTEVLDYLAKRVDVNEKDSYGFTALGLAFFSGQDEIVRALLQNGAELPSVSDSLALENGVIQSFLLSHDGKRLISISGEMHHCNPFLYRFKIIQDVADILDDVFTRDAKLMLENPGDYYADFNFEEESDGEADGTDMISSLDPQLAEVLHGSLRRRNLDGLTLEKFLQRSMVDPGSMESCQGVIYRLSGRVSRSSVLPLEGGWVAQDDPICKLILMSTDLSRPAVDFCFENDGFRDAIIADVLFTSSPQRERVMVKNIVENAPYGLTHIVVGAAHAHPLVVKLMTEHGFGLISAQDFEYFRTVLQ